MSSFRREQATGVFSGVAFNVWTVGTTTPVPVCLRQPHQFALSRFDLPAKQIGPSENLLPGTLIGPNGMAYGLCNIDRGLYDARTLFKNSPMDAKAIEVVSVDPSRV